MSALLEDDLKALDELVANAPKPIQRRRNLIDIAGYPSRETVLSNFLAFYFDEQEQHGFKRSLLDAFKTILSRKSGIPMDTLDGEYAVEREYDNIDILIGAKSDGDKFRWAILVENKVFHVLHNDLRRYWNSVKAESKVGAVISIESLDAELTEWRTKGVNFINVLYSELMHEWKQSLASAFLDTDDRHLLYLKDFIHHIESFYPDPRMQQEQSESLRLFQDNSELIDKLTTLSTQVHQYAVSELTKTMGMYGFVPKTNTVHSKSKDYVIDDPRSSPGSEGFKFWFFVDDLFRYNYLTVNFELYGKWTQYGDELRKRVEKEIMIDGTPLKYGKSGGPGSGFCHILTIYDFDISKAYSGSFSEMLQQVIADNFFDEQHSRVHTCFRLLKEIGDGK